ncbi:TetR/AcrR family transcriptional regulator [uncultured Arcticibacterium sp.]|uniref:TetR/AcrR family transcriptional regulator n=1 Tax=uncultured Arcticibacterium sp. TaxID=2173042 RepID=UPI0030F691E4
MPKETFFNIGEAKRTLITEAFLREFALKPFDEASISEVVKQLGIAKGSVYQYFEDKLDLFLYLLKESGGAKKNYVGSIERESFPDFWVFFKALFKAGLEFDRERPLHSHFLFNLIKNLQSPTIEHLYKDMLSSSVLAFEEMVKVEIAKGLFRNDVSSEIMGFMLYKVGVSIQEQMEFKGFINPKESIFNSEPVYKDKHEHLMNMVDDYILMVKPTFDKN